jgi:hypothetical protein
MQNMASVDFPNKAMLCGEAEFKKEKKNVLEAEFELKPCGAT